MKKIMKITIIIIIMLFIVQQLLSSNATRKTETPEYEVLQTMERVEIRKYPGLIMASTKMGPNGYSKESGNGFRTIAGYIFGGNESNQQISMTSPVMVEMSDTMKMSFIMPSSYALDNLPDPDSPQVLLHEENSRTMAVIRYGGFSNDQKFEEYKEILAKTLEQNNIQVKGPFMYFGYNPPYELINRRNEVAVEINWE